MLYQWSERSGEEMMLYIVSLWELPWILSSCQEPQPLLWGEEIVCSSQHKTRAGNLAGWVISAGDTNTPIMTPILPSWVRHPIRGPRLPHMKLSITRHDTLSRLPEYKSFDQNITELLQSTFICYVIYVENIMSSPLLPRRYSMCFPSGSLN